MKREAKALDDRLRKRAEKLTVEMIDDFYKALEKSGKTKFKCDMASPLAGYVLYQVALCHVMVEMVLEFAAEKKK